MCEGVPSAGEFYYMQNIYNGFTHVHVEEKQVIMRIIGINSTTNETFDLYKVTINNDKKAEVQNPFFQ
jgi:hypothetical protein